MTQAMTEMNITSEELRHIAVESLIDAIVTHRSEWPPQGWCDQFDAAHSYIPDWACKEPHVAFVTHCRGHEPARRHALAQSVRRWLMDNPDAPELRRAISNASDAYADRDADPQGWAQYEAYLVHDVPY